VLEAVIEVKDSGMMGGVALLFWLVAIIGIVVSGVVHWIRRPVPPALALLPVGGVLLAGLVAWYSGRAQAFDMLAHASAELRGGATAGLSTQLAAGLLVGFLLPPLAVVGGALSAGGALRQEGRAWGLGALTGAVAVVCAGACLVPLVVSQDVGAIVSLACTLLLAGLLAAFASTATDRSGRLATVVATCLLAVAVSAGWVLELSLLQREILQVVLGASPGLEVRLAQGGALYLDWLSALAWAPVLLALVPPVAAVGRVAEPADRPGALLGLAMSALGVAWLAAVGSSLLPVILAH